MKISLNWLKEYIDLDLPPLKVSEMLTSTGLEIEAMDINEPVAGGLEGVVIGKVLTCDQHPNADRLVVTTVDIGEDTPSHIVCGAPNVAAGQTVLVAKVGTTLYPTNSEPFKIKKSKIRGEYSEGMICAEDEVGIGQRHEGVMVLETDLKPGHPAIDYFDFTTDYIYEIGLTPNRADATSHLGVARDLKALLNKEVRWPSVDNFKVDKKENKIDVIVEDSVGCPRYSALSISGITVKDSPEWLQTKLRSIGLVPINNIVDITNFVMYETGQPLHAFDQDKITGNKVVVKTLPEKTKFVTLDEKEWILKSNDLMICNAEQGMCIAGVFGGIKSGISKNTKTIFLESAYFTADYIRKTAQYHGLKTDASFRFERGTDPNMTVYALKRAAMIIKEVAGGEITSEVIDNYPNEINDFEVMVKYKNVNRLIGKKIPPEEIFRILENLEIRIDEKTDQGFKALVPPYRVDVQREADIIEEILRIYGFDNVELPEYFSSSYLADFPLLDPDKYQQKVSALLVSNGFYEIITNSLTRSGYAEKSGYLNADNNVEILNKLSEDLGVLRQTLLFTGLEVIAYNLNRKQSDLKFFEIGNVYKKEKGKYFENNRLSIFLTGHLSKPHWSGTPEKVKFHDLYHYVDLVLKRMLNSSVESKPYHQDPFDYGLELSIHKKVFGKIGKVKSSLMKDFGIKEEIFFADLDWDLLLKKTNHNIVFEEVGKFPEVKRDLSLVIDKKVSFEEIMNVVEKSDTYLIKDINVFDVYEGEKIDKNKKAYALNFVLQDKKKTMTEKMIDKVMNRLMSAFEKELNAIIRK